MRFWQKQRFDSLLHAAKARRRCRGFGWNFLGAVNAMNARGRRIFDSACINPSILGLPWMESDWNGRSEEHTSELQSLMRISYAVFCLKKTMTQYHISVQKLRSKKDTTTNNHKIHTRSRKT